MTPSPMILLHVPNSLLLYIYSKHSSKRGFPRCHQRWRSKFLLLFTWATSERELMSSLHAVLQTSISPFPRSLTQRLYASFVHTPVVNLDPGETLWHLSA
ncbi:hypothetical protein MPTK1_7g10410 [Marchantia polymorpha subsp. ruderalis]|uniref:Uncharacterized protein n=2 Tax=Marchantia polymorpha TaxID=3197 RepID=A0AAF6BY33_MARPO|nr:hypothetical protein MARPO_0003s0060 [Marchantia polymorpha]BBN16917.1 hypothetical protein Mp_7g10410 [Marchantia polymorpha subsp. ruderalis]|eukprot:PTQ49158.1 hypothetical protein MARPO_0003s0060 [Marchantia polymorpha]